MAKAKVTALTGDEMRKILRSFVSEKGSLQRAADLLSTSPSHLCEILAGERSIGDKIAAQLGYAVIKESKRIKVIYYLGEAPKK